MKFLGKFSRQNWLVQVNKTPRAAAAVARKTSREIGEILLVETSSEEESESSDEEMEPAASSVLDSDTDFSESEEVRCHVLISSCTWHDDVMIMSHSSLWHFTDLEKEEKPKRIRRMATLEERNEKVFEKCDRADCVLCSSQFGIPFLFKDRTADPSYNHPKWVYKKMSGVGIEPRSKQSAIALFGYLMICGEEKEWYKLSQDLYPVLEKHWSMFEWRSSGR